MILFLFLVAATAAAGQPRALTAADAVSVSGVTGFLVSPNGDIAYSRSKVDWDSGKSTTSWTTLEGKLGFAPENASSVSWSADGAKVAFFETREGKTWLRATTGAMSAVHNICQVHTPNAYLQGTGNRIAWSPDGARIAFVGTLEPTPAPADPLVITRIQYKSRTGMSDNRRLQVYVVEATPGATPKALTAADRDSHSIGWGKRDEVVFLANPEPDADANHNYDIFAVNIFTSAARQITKTPGVEYGPVVSPDGNWIAYTATTRKITTIDSVAEDTHAWVTPYGGGRARELNRELDRRSFGPRWTPDSKAVIYLAADRGRVLPYLTELESSSTRALLDLNAAVSGLQVTGKGEMYFTMSSPASVAALYRMKPGETKPERLTEESGAAWRFTMPEAFRVSSFDSKPVEAFYYPPLDQPKEKAPLLLAIHGGPHGMHGYAFNATFQYYAARGYAVLAVNPRGSSGYGQQFADGCNQDWGGGDYKDLMAATDAALKRYPVVDAGRLGVLGGSYGGFMTNWVITQTQRFRAAVSSASLSNLISFYATSLYQDLVHAEFNGFPWEGDNFHLLWKWSPLAHVSKAKTPTLLLHGENDNDVHVTQAEEMFTALRRRGVETVLVRYPREGHGFREPKHRLDALQRTLDWFDRFLIP
ncbi:MAG: S9 family peptidase [Acidimicrobiia bacterium]|nr:S9 family peptidase [Acidimicrobiia bacterium]